jgi:hypothetical protein
LINFLSSARKYGHFDLHLNLNSQFVTSCWSSNYIEHQYVQDFFFLFLFFFS